AASDASARANQLMNAAAMLASLRRYAWATELLRAAQRGSDSPEIRVKLQMLSKLKRHENIGFPKDDPREPVIRFLDLALTGNCSPDTLRDLIRTKDSAESWIRIADQLRQRSASVRAMGRSNGLSRDLSVDMLLSSADLRKEGDGKTGYRIDAIIPFSTGSPSFFVI